MKIAIDIREAAGKKAGKGWYTYNLVNALLSLDSQNEYLLYTKESQPDFLKYKNAKQKEIRLKGIRWHLKTLKDIKKEKVDMFIAPTSYIIPALAPKSIKTLVVVHDLIALLFPKHHNKKAVFVEKLTLKQAVKKSSIMVTVSQNTKDDLLQRFKVDSQKMHVVYPAVNKAFKDLDKSLIDWKERENLAKNFLLFVGTLEPRKNIEKLLEAHAQLIDPKKKRKEQIHLVVVGSRGWNFSKIFSKLNELKTGEYVQFRGYVEEEELVKYYNSAIALVFPSLYEGFGLPPLEAMKSGCPVITSNISSLPEVVGDSALLVNPKNTEELALAMKKLYDNEELRLKLRTKGLKQAEDFSWPKTAEAMLSIINKTDEVPKF